MSTYLFLHMSGVEKDLLYKASDRDHVLWRTYSPTEHQNTSKFIFISTTSFKKKSFILAFSYHGAIHLTGDTIGHLQLWMILELLLPCLLLVTMTLNLRNWSHELSWHLACAAIISLCFSRNLLIDFTPIPDCPCHFCSTFLIFFSKFGIPVSFVSSLVFLYNWHKPYDTNDDYYK